MLGLRRADAGRHAGRLKGAPGPHFQRSGSIATLARALDSVNTPLKEGDEVSIVPAIAGG